MYLHSDLTLPYATGETPASFCSRVAWRLGRTARQLCADLGLSFQSIVDGENAALAQLAQACQINLDALRADAFIRIPARFYALRGELFSRDNLVRHRLRACPDCIRQDRETGMEIPFGRAFWQIKAIQTCPHHNRSIVEITTVHEPALLHDFAAGIEPRLVDHKEWVSRSVERAPSSFERYILDRLNGIRTESWLGQFPLYAAVKICEVLGAVRLFGPRYDEDRISDHDRHAAGAAGHEIASRGSSGIEPLLSDLIQSAAQEADDWKMRTIFGRLHGWLAYSRGDHVYDPLRRVIHNHWIRVAPVAAGETIFNIPVEERQCHSVRSAALETGLHPNRLRKILSAAGALDATSDGLPDNRATFDAVKYSVLLGDLIGCMNLKEAASYLGLPRPLDRLILLRNPPLIEPLVSLEQEKLNPTFSRTALDLFRARLFRAANPSPAGINLPDIRFAAKRLNCSVLEIVDLILEGKVHPFRTGDDEVFASLLVDPETVRPYIHSVEKPGLTARDVEKRLRTNTATVRALLANGKLPVTMQRHPVQRGLQPFIPFDAVETFEDRYISLFNLARETGIHFLKVKSLIDQCGIEPSFKGSEIPTTFYPRSAALHALSGALASQAEPVGRR